MLQRFEHSNLGSKESKKKRENVSQTVRHVADLIHHMWDEREGQPAGHLKYLDNREHFNKYASFISTYQLLSHQFTFLDINYFSLGG